MKLKSILYILMLLPFLWSCNNEDDVEEIFASGTWHVVDFYGKANWDKRNGEPKYNAMAHNPDKTIAAEGRKALDIIHGFNITFKADGTFTGSIQTEPLKAHGKRMERPDSKHKFLPRLHLQQAIITSS